MSVTQNPVASALKTIYETVQHFRSGKVATYIPELAQANPEHFAICLATVDGHMYRLGDHEIPFTIQSISKPFVFGLALEDLGLERVLQKVKVEPSGEAFNSISLEPDTGRPYNPMINAGAIATTAMIQGDSMEERKQRLLAMMGRYCGRAMTIDERVFHSERETGHRNHAIAYLLRNANILKGDVQSDLDLYFAQCSVSVTCEDLAWMAATLANLGRNPRTGEVALQAAYVEHVLSIMATCGMYDYAGSWLFRVGIPAKSGVSGGIIAVLPGQFGIGIFSPALDVHGNSVRGIAVCEQLSHTFGLHMLKANFSTPTVLRACYTLAEVPSKRMWRDYLAQQLKTLGQQVRIYELQGSLFFGTAEVLFRDMVRHLTNIQIVIFNCKRVQSIDQATARMFASFIHDYTGCKGQVLFAHLEPNDPMYTFLEQALITGSYSHTLHCFASSDFAKEWCEEYLLAQAGIHVRDQAELPLAEHPAFAQLPDDALALIQAQLVRQPFQAGNKVIQRGEVANTIYFLMQGRISVNLTLPDRYVYRLTTMGPGSVFGEMAIFDGGPRSADIDAQTDGVCQVLTVAALTTLRHQIPGLYERICEKLAQDLTVRLRKANTEILALDLD